MKQRRIWLGAVCLSGMLLSACQQERDPAVKSVHAEAGRNTKTQLKETAQLSQDSVFKEFGLLEKDAEPLLKKRLELERIQMMNNEGIVPYRLLIPKLKMDAKIEKTGLLKNKQMGVPTNDKNAAWFEPGTKPGELGSAVIDGHVDNKTGPAVFFRLKELTAGDEITLFDKNDKKMIFVVQEKKSYPYENAPVEEIFGKRDKQRLNLITCTGLFDRSKGTHQERLVVYTTLKEDQGMTAGKAPITPGSIMLTGSFLTWHAVREESVIGYRIYQKGQNGDVKWVKSISSMERKSFTVSDDPAAEFYVTAVDLFGKESKPSAVVKSQ
ncbi:class F sortase [Peribacillus kribbensis]|uniref:class F sortase n=1 Tax=Peribacillus kribbensis TaxID=356658 RepID=UPI0004072788|nr:class F sortase [Peribacillus kribbensis]